VVGELQGGVGTEYMLKKGYRPDMAIVAEPNDQDSVLTVHAGWLEMAVNVIGKSSHISQQENGINAIKKMSKVIKAINGLELSHSPYSELPALPRLHVGAVIGGQGRDHVINGANFVPDFCTAIVDGRMVPGQNSDMVLADVREALDIIKAKDPEFDYEIEFPPPAKYRVLRTTMEPMDMPVDQYIVQALSRNYQVVTGDELACIGSKIPNSYSGNDTTHMWKAGIPCILYGPGGGWDESEDEPDAYVRISDMVTCSKVMAATALEVCNKPS
jgi:acetylornithine deacetylase